MKVVLGRRLLGAISPLLDQLNVNYRPAIQGIAAYDQGKADVMYGVNNVMTTMQRVRRQVPVRLGRRSREKRWVA